MGREKNLLPIFALFQGVRALSPPGDGNVPELYLEKHQEAAGNPLPQVPFVRTSVHFGCVNALTDLFWGGFLPLQEERFQRAEETRR